MNVIVAVVLLIPQIAASEIKYFKNIDDYTLSGESKNWSEEKKKGVVLQIVNLTIGVSSKRVSNETINSIVNSL